MRVAVHPPLEGPLQPGASLSGTLDFRAGREASAGGAAPRCSEAPPHPSPPPLAIEMRRPWVSMNPARAASSACWPVSIKRGIDRGRKAGSIAAGATLECSRKQVHRVQPQCWQQGGLGAHRWRCCWRRRSRWRHSGGPRPAPAAGSSAGCRPFPTPPLPPPLFPPYAAKEMGRTQHSNAVAGALIDELPGSLRGCMCSGGDRPVHQAARHL